MLVLELFNQNVQEYDAWHAKDHPFSGGDQWHTPDLSENTMSDIITAREILGNILNKISDKSEYGDFLKHIRKHHGPEYSTTVHQHACRLARQGNK